MRRVKMVMNRNRLICGGSQPVFLILLSFFFLETVTSHQGFTSEDASLALYTPALVSIHQNL